MNLDQEKRVMIAFALSIVMLILYRMYFVKEQPPPPKTAAPAAVATPAGQPGAPKTTSGAGSAAAPKAAPAPAVLPVLQGAKPEEIVVENKLYAVTFSTQGAVVKSWVLKDYRDAKDQPLDTVNAPACESLGYPMSLSLGDPALKARVNEGIYVVKAVDARAVPSGQEPAVQTGNAFSSPVTLTFTYSDGKVQVKKQFTFGADYVVKVAASAFDGQSNLPVEVTWPGGFGDHTLTSAAIESYRQGVYGSIGDLTTVSQGKVKEDRTIPGPLQVAGLEDKFFADVFLPDLPEQVSFKLARQEWSPPDWTEKDKPKPLAATLVETQPKPLEFRLFVGPKNLDVLKSVNPPLDSLVDFGWLSIIAKPLFICLRYIDEHWVHNYGWAIVLLTVIITAAMFPLRIKSLRSAQEMQKVAPIIKGIQDKYKGYKFNDPRKQKMNEEVMAVYKEHGVNPLGGCLPSLIPMAFLWPFYRVLDLAIELRHAPWIWWVKDLSAPDRLNIPGLPFSIPVLVILMTIASFYAQRMMPMATADPAQQRMMMMMPLIMGFMFYRFASGMVLYWLTSSVVQLLQQIAINHFMPPPPSLLVARKPAEAKR